MEDTIDAATSDGNEPSGDSPVLTNNQAAAWINEGENGPYLTVEIATGRFNLFSNDDAAEEALQHIFENAGE